MTLQKLLARKKKMLSTNDPVSLSFGSFIQRRRVQTLRKILRTQISGKQEPQQNSGAQIRFTASDKVEEILFQVIPFQGTVTSQKLRMPFGDIHKEIVEGNQNVQGNFQQSQIPGGFRGTNERTFDHVP